MLKSLQKLLTLALIVFGVVYLAYQGFHYTRAQDKMPPGMTIAGLDVSGLTKEEVSDLLTAQFTTPLILVHRDEEVELNPQDVGFQLDLEAMLAEADIARTPENPWLSFAEFVVGRSWEPIHIDLYATHDRDALLARLDMLASFLDEPATGPQLIEDSTSFRLGRAGYVSDIETSLPDIEAALYAIENRTAELVVIDQEAIPFDMGALEDSIKQEMAGFNGMGSIFVMDLESGEELGINADVALSGLSVVKIAILLETYRAMDFEPNSDQAKLIAETAVHSGNFSANLLLDVVAGQDNAYLGVDILTESMQRLGLNNTFIVTPYEEPNRPGKSTRVTEANSRVDVTTFPDPTMQTTAEDMGTLLSMIYHCALGGGTLLVVYPDEITPAECQAIIDVLAENEEGNLIRFGVPEGVTVSHKHGWAGNTHGDAGIVYSPDGDYIIVEYLTDPDSDWLVHDTSFPILREISRTVYNYFNYEHPYFDDRLAEIEAEESNSGAQFGEVQTDETAVEEPTPQPTPEPVNPDPGDQDDTENDGSDLDDISIEANRSVIWNIGA